MNVEVKALGSNQANCYMLSGEDFAVVIDPGEDDAGVIEFGRNNSGKKYKYIILTHCHFDHIGGVRSLKEVFKAPVLIDKNDAAGLADTAVNLSADWSDKKISLSADGELSDGDKIDLGETKITVMETPGHTVGCICLFLDDCVFTGDTLFHLAVGRYDVPTSHVRQLISSLKKLGNLDKDYIVYPGHGEKTTLEYEKKYNRFFSRVLNEIK